MTLRLSYQVSSGGAVKINSVANNVYGSAAVKTAMGQLVQQARSHVLENEYNHVAKRSIGSEGIITAGIGAGAAVGTGAEFAPLNALPTNNSLGASSKWWRA